MNDTNINVWEFNDSGYGYGRFTHFIVLSCPRGSLVFEYARVGKPEKHPKISSVEVGFADPSRCCHRCIEIISCRRRPEYFDNSIVFSFPCESKGHQAFNRICALLKPFSFSRVVSLLPIRLHLIPEHIQLRFKNEIFIRSCHVTSRYQASY